MATQRNLRSTGLDNQLRTGKAGAFPSKLGVQPRNALGNIGNVVSMANTRSRALSLKQEAIPKPERSLHRQKGLASLSSVEDVVSVPVPVPAPSLDPVPVKALPEPMEVAAETQVPVFAAFSALSVEDIDCEDVQDPQMVTEVVNDVYIYLRSLERTQEVRQNYLQSSLGTSSITPKMRSVLIDWLIDVHQQFNLMQETLYLTVYIIDRYLQEEALHTQKKALQLIGVSAMFIASKYEEMYSPEIRDFVYITDNTYTESQIRQMEIKIVQTLNFELGRPLPLNFLRRNSKAGFVNAKIHTLAKYVMELSLMDYKLAHIYPSMLAAAALAYSMRIFDEDENVKLVDMWTPTLVHYSSYTMDDILPLIRELAKLVQKTVIAPKDAKLMQVRKKYSGKKLMAISQHPLLKSSVALGLAEDLE